MDDRQFKELTSRLDAIIKLLALGLPQTLSLADKIVMMRDAGLKNAQIAQILGTSEGYVSVALDRAKKSKSKEPRG